jgi:hypothetical protein
MKKTILMLSAICFISSAVFAQTKTQTKTPQDHKAVAAPMIAPPPTPPTPPAPVKENLSAANVNIELDKKITINKLEHDFGSIPEGPKVTTDFVVKNISKDTIVLTRVQASCGCTQPEYTAGKILPGESTIIKAIYNTDGRPNGFEKTLTIYMEQGSKAVKIKGNVTPKAVTPAPPTPQVESVPAPKK